MPPASSTADLTAMQADLDRLRAAMQRLEPDRDDREQLGLAVMGHALDFLDCVETAPSYRPANEVFDCKLDPEFTAQGRSVDDVLDFIAASVDRPGIATTSPRFMGYIPGGGLFQSGL